MKKYLQLFCFLSSDIYFARQQDDCAGTMNFLGFLRQRYNLGGSET